MGFVDNENFDNYLRAIYWAVSTLCTVGYGDIRAFNDGKIYFFKIINILLFILIEFYLFKYK